MAELVIRQFDVFDNPDVEARQRVPLIIALQSHLLYVLDTVVVAPLYSTTRMQADGLISLPVEIAGSSYTLAMGALGNIAQRRLGKAITNLRDQDYAIQRALDRLFTGF